MRDTTASEYVDWMKHIHEEEWEHHPAIHYYLAQIACEIWNFRQAWTKSPKWKTPEDFLIKFKTSEEVEKAKQEKLDEQRPISEEEEIRLRQEAVDREKAFWVSWAEAHTSDRRRQRGNRPRPGPGP